MDINVNPITIGLVALLAVPLVQGALEPLSLGGIRQRLWSLLDTLGFFLALYMAIVLTRRIFFDHESGVFLSIYNWIPENIRVFLYGQDVLIYIIVVPIFLLILIELIRLLTPALFKRCLLPLADRLYASLANSGRLLSSSAGALAQVPRAAFMVFIAGLLLNFFAYYCPSPSLSKWMNESTAYQGLYRQALYPALNSNLAKKVPVLVNDSFAQALDRVIPRETPDGSPAPQRSVRVIEYFNGVTLDEAIKSNPQIDQTARTIVGNESNSKKKAYLIYQWVSSHIEYDYDKAATISRDARGIQSGSQVAFGQRKGICFDYSCLYISMCRAVGLNVRLITGLGYSGISWGDHAWNQVYSSEEQRWINLDATFGTNGRYFDKPDFNADHRYAEIQGEW